MSNALALLSQEQGYTPILARANATGWQGVGRYVMTVGAMPIGLDLSRIIAPLESVEQVRIFCDVGVIYWRDDGEELTPGCEGSMRMNALNVLDVLADTTDISKLRFVAHDGNAFARVFFFSERGAV